MDPLSPSKVVVSTWKVHVRTYIQTSRQTEMFFGLFCLLTYKSWTFVKRREFFFFTHAITILSLFTYSVCDEKVKIKKYKNGVCTCLTWIWKKCPYNMSQKNCIQQVTRSQLYYNLFEIILLNYGVKNALYQTYCK